MSTAQPLRRSARLAAKYPTAAPPLEPRAKTTGERRAERVRALRAARDAAAAANATIEHAVDPPAPSQAVFPPEVTTSTELVLRIRIPVRRFPPATQSVKQQVIGLTRFYLGQIEREARLSERLLLMVDLYNYLISQPILLAYSPQFRATAIERLDAIEQEVKARDGSLLYDHLFYDVKDEFALLLTDLPYHPWWRGTTAFPGAPS